MVDKGASLKSRLLMECAPLEDVDLVARPVVDPNKPARILSASALPKEEAALLPVEEVFG